MLFERLLVANRGEIAIRILRGAAELEIHTVAIYSHEDRFALHRYKADEAYKLGEPGNPIDAYLNWQRIIAKAKELKIDAIHPGYGFLSENVEFAQAVQDAGITFIGPSPKILEIFGNKLLAKKYAAEVGIEVIPGTDRAVQSVDEARRFVEHYGYPVTLKALAGGGGKGIRAVHNRQQLETEFPRAQSEAQTSFGKSDIYIEKTIQSPRHIEIQIMGDAHGQVVHLFERDCSIQRRHQKVVEIAPALGISQECRELLYDYSVRLAKHVNYVGIGTIEYLVDQNNKPYFLEVNPRIQVEHTVTEMITGKDLVQASIVIAAGRSMTHPAIGIDSQESISKRGVAIQCRITTEDPQNNFTPDIGTISVYRPAQGFGVRLDEGLATSGGKVTLHYDSLLVKLTAFGLDLYGTARKMLRSLREFRIRGVKTNVPLLINIISHPKFFQSKIDTAFLTNYPEVFKFPQPKDRATKVLSYLADVTVNNPHDLPTKKYNFIRAVPKLNKPTITEEVAKTAKEVFDQEGVKGLVNWTRRQKKLLLTDTTMRDAHQSLFATRLRTIDTLQVAPFYDQYARGLFSLEVWGGATFDTCLRFLKEDPWDRLAKIREKIPNTLLQMLLRGDNAVGYTNYPEWVIRDFIRLTVEAGLDLFRIFDCLNNPPLMAVAIDEVKKRGAIAEACICYTGNVTSPSEKKYTLEYYIGVAKELTRMGTDILCIKDMAGLLRPESARVLISALKEQTDLPIHLHTHDTSGNGVAMLLSAAQAGCDIIDGAVSSMSGLTSQPSLNAIVAALEDSEFSPDVDLLVLDELSKYWEGVRAFYQAFDPGIKSTSTRVYQHEIPGGQYSNLCDQARKVGVSADEFFELTEKYREVNELFGNIIKVTPASKAVGDMALLLQKTSLTAKQLLEKKPKLDYPDSVVSFFKGHMGTPYQGFPKEIRALVLGPNPPPPEKPEVLETDSFEQVKTELEKKLDEHVSPEQVLSYRLYPKVFLEYARHLKTYGKVDSLPTPQFFYGLEENKEFEVDLESGKTLIIELKGISEPDEFGKRTVFFQLNGYSRQVRVIDQSIKSAVAPRKKADSTSALHIGATMPCKVVEVKCKEQDHVSQGNVVVITEAMKMEYTVTAKQSGKIKKIYVATGDMVEEGDLLVELQ